MSSVSKHVTVSAGPERVWSVLSDFGRLAEWAPMVHHSCLVTEQTHGVGAARRVQMGNTVLIERVVVWEPESELGYELDGLPPLLGRVTNTWTLAPAASGTAVTVTATIDAGHRPLLRLIAPLAGRKLGETTGQLARALAEHLEASS